MSPDTRRPYLSVEYEHQRPERMATPLLMAYSIARQVVLPADLMSRPWPEQVEVIRATIERHCDPQIVTPFGRVVSYRFRTVSGEAVRFDTAGNLLTVELGSSPNLPARIQ